MPQCGVVEEPYLASSNWLAATTAVMCRWVLVGWFLISFNMSCFIGLHDWASSLCMWENIYIITIAAISLYGCTASTPNWWWWKHFFESYSQLNIFCTSKNFSFMDRFLALWGTWFQYLLSFWPVSPLMPRLHIQLVSDLVVWWALNRMLPRAKNRAACGLQPPWLLHPLSLGCKINIVFHQAG